MQNQLTQDHLRLPLGSLLLNLAIVDCLVGVAGYVYLNVLHAGEALAVSPMGSAAMTLMWISWWLSLGGLAVGLPAALVLPRARALWLSIAVNTVYVLPLALLLASRHFQLGEGV
jgi:hypothetical protein